MTTRRSILALVSTVAASTAGCLSRLRDRAARDEPTKSVEIAGVTLHNLADEPRSIALRIDDGDATVAFRERFALDPDSVKRIDAPVSGDGEYAIRAELGTTTVRERMADYAGPDEDCVLPSIWVRGDELFVRTRAYDGC